MKPSPHSRWRRPTSIQLRTLNPRGGPTSIQLRTEAFWETIPLRRLSAPALLL